MPQTRFVPGYGPVEFPDEMDSKEVEAYIDKQAAAQVPELTGLPGVPLPKVDMKEVPLLGLPNLPGSQTAQMGMGLTAPDVKNVNAPLALGDMATGAAQGGPLGAATSLILGQVLDPKGNRNPKDVWSGGLGAGVGAQGTAGLLKRFAGGRVSGWGELAKGLMAGLGQTAGEKAVGTDPGMMPALAQTASGALGGLMQGMSNKLNKAPRLVSNRLIEQMLEGTGMSTDDIFTANRYGKSGPAIREIQTKIAAKNPGQGNPTIQQKILKNEFKGTVGGPLSLTADKLANKMIPRSSAVNEYRVWKALKDNLSPTAYKGAVQSAMMETISKSFDSSSGMLNPALMKQLDSMQSSGILSEMFGTPDRAKAIVKGLDDLIKAQEAMFKVNAGDMAGHAMGAIGGGSVASHYHTAKILSKIPGAPMRSMQNSTPNLRAVAMGIVQEPGKYAKTLQWLAKHGTTAPNSLVRAAVATLTTGNE
jgi:hypothetical protein